MNVALYQYNEIKHQHILNMKLPAAVKGSVSIKALLTTWFSHC